MVSYRVVWSTEAREQLKAICTFIKKDSEKNALRVRQDVLERTRALSEQPLRYPPDPLRRDKDHSFRAFSIHKLRITYFVDEALLQVDILRVRSAYQEPLEY